MTRLEVAGSVLRYFLAGCATLSLVGCTSGTLSGIQQSCESTFGLLESKKVSCTGSVDTVSGSPTLSVIEAGENLNEVYPEDVPGSEDEEKVDLQIKVAEGQEVRGLRYEANLVAQD